MSRHHQSGDALHLEEADEVTGGSCPCRFTASLSLDKTGSLRSLPWRLRILIARGMDSVFQSRPACHCSDRGIGYTLLRRLWALARRERRSIPAAFCDGVSNEARAQRRRNPLSQGSFSQPLRRSLVVDRLDPPPRSLLAAGQNPAWQSVSYPTV